MAADSHAALGVMYISVMTRCQAGKAREGGRLAPACDPPVGLPSDHKQRGQGDTCRKHELERDLRIRKRR